MFNSSLIMQKSVTFDLQPSVVTLKNHYDTVTSKTHLKDLLQDQQRNDSLVVKIGDQLIADFTHTKIDMQGL